ncbi:trypsin-like serine peptidase [Sphaerisporangium corydalis]|uniref:Trypsin-like serine peptidase n=1 Tax=Sphaerisporangium corydalis TaxID=1441875 RepID=A0ABV9E4R6_9ACTN|nr:peptidase [Sphaerisporangium corydalis]
MHRTARRLIPILVISPIAAGGILLTAPTAQAARPVSPRPIVHDAADTKTEQGVVKRFWTPAKMEAAKPLDLVRSRAGRTTTAPGGGTAVAPGARSVKRADTPATPATPTPSPSAPASASASPSPSATPSTTPAAPAALSSRSSGAAWTAGGTVVKTEGRVFFTYQGRSASCSGTAVTSANKSVVITAGHCVKLGGAFHTNWVFVPGYDNGSRPYGTWIATNLLTTTQWNATEDMNYDMAAAVVAPLNGQLLTDVVGGQGVAFNQARGRQMYAFGYPAASPYNGSKLIYCAGRVFEDYLVSTDQGLSCDMTGGSSGGGWFQNFDQRTGAGTLNSVNSFKYNFAPYWMFGPYFGPEAQAVYTTAQTEDAT